MYSVKKEKSENYKKEREILDPIHGFISLPSISWSFIDTEEFQRLRRLKQLGNSHFVFPGGTHTRFEHCIGTGYLSNLVMNFLDKEIQDIIPNNVKEDYVNSVTLAGLLHDIGHGPFSHLYDKLLEELYHDKYGKSCLVNNLCEHEYRSTALIDNIIDKYHLEIPSLVQKLTKNLILGEEHYKLFDYDDETDEKIKWIYQIVANKKNSIDVDKFDYLQRDCYMIGLKSGKPNFNRIFSKLKIINNEICYNIKTDNDIFNLFQIRHKQYKQIYYHKTTVAIDLMCKDAMKLTNSYFNYLDCIETGNLDKFCSYDDSILNKIRLLKSSITDLKNSSDEKYDDCVYNDIVSAGNIIERIYNRDLYSFVFEVVVIDDLKHLYNNINPIDICIGNITPNDFIINYHHVDYGNKDKDPFNGIDFYYSYQNNNHTTNTKIWKTSLSVPNSFKEKYIRVYSRNSSKDSLIKEGFLTYIKKHINDYKIKLNFEENNLIENDTNEHQHQSNNEEFINKNFILHSSSNILNSFDTGIKEIDLNLNLNSMLNKKRDIG